MSRKVAMSKETQKAMSAKRREIAKHKANIKELEKQLGEIVKRELTDDKGHLPIGWYRSKSSNYDFSKGDLFYISRSKSTKDNTVDIKGTMLWTTQEVVSVVEDERVFKTKVLSFRESDTGELTWEEVEDLEPISDLEILSKYGIAKSHMDLIVKKASYGYNCTTCTGELREVKAVVTDSEDDIDEIIDNARW